MVATIADLTIDLVLTAVDPIHHGAGTSGNTALLRTQDIVTPQGRQVAVPYVSGNSIRHSLRDALAWHLVRTLGLAAGSLTVGQVALLWSGGALSEPGAKIDVDRLRRVDELLPHLTLLGYSAGNDIVTSTLRATHAHLVCAENVWRMPPILTTWKSDLTAQLAPHVRRPAGAYRGENFGTRHDPSGGPTDRLLADSGMFDAAPKTPTQMIYDFQVLRPGSVLWARLALEAGAPAQLDALTCALLQATRDGEMILGARRAVGYGRCTVTWPDPTISDLLTADRVERYTQHLADHKAEILELLGELAR